MAVDGSLGVHHSQGAEELLQGYALLVGTCVLWGFAVGGKTAYVANSDAVGVVIGAVGSGDVDVTAVFLLAVGVNDVVIGNVGETALLMPLANCVEWIVTTVGCGRAVDYYLGDCACGLLQLSVS